MAGRSHLLLKQTYRLFSSSGSEVDGPTAGAFASSPVAADEFDESDVWGSVAASAAAADATHDYGGKNKPAYPGSRVAARKPSGTSVVPASLPVNIPDWSKILRDEYMKNNSGDDGWDAEEDDGASGSVVPPHEYLWRKRGAVAASFSVHEGVGRTLKGRDLSRVRNAVWQQTGFQD